MQKRIILHATISLNLQSRLNKIWIKKLISKLLWLKMRLLKIYIFQRKKIQIKVNSFKLLSLNSKLFNKITFIK